jgi:hypothetical protein
MYDRFAMIKKNAVFIVLLSNLLLSACSFFASSKRYYKSEDLKISFNKPPWNEVKTDTSDIAFQNGSTSSMMLVNSNCKKFDSSKLEHLVNDILSGIESIQFLENNNLKFKGRESIQSKIQGKLDGVDIFLSLVVLKKDHCIYDFVHMAKDRPTLEKESHDFNDLLNLATIEGSI